MELLGKRKHALKCRWRHRELIQGACHQQQRSKYITQFPCDFLSWLAAQSKPTCSLPCVSTTGLPSVVVGEGRKGASE